MTRGEDREQNEELILFHMEEIPDWSVWLGDQVRRRNNMFSKQTADLPIPTLTKDGKYELYKQEVRAWEIITSIPVKERAMWLALSISKDHPLDIKSKVLGNGVGVEKLNVKDGVKNMLAFLDQVYKKDIFVDMNDFQYPL